jgi:hypothetical protein
MLLTARLDTETANHAASDGTMLKMIDGIIEQLKPEATYFTPTEGDRSCVFVFDMKDAAEMPGIAEPFFQAGAKVTLQPVMNHDDLAKGLSSLGK